MSDDMMARLQQTFYDLRFFEQVRGDARCTVLCHADDHLRLQAAVEHQGLADILTVTVSPIVKAGQMIVLDTAAYDAAMAETLQTMMRRPLL